MSEFHPEVTGESLWDGGVPIRLLIVEDVAAEAALLVREIRHGGMSVEALRVDTRAALENALAEFSPDLVISDYSLPGFGGMEALDLVRATAPEVPLVFVSGTIGEELAIQALTRGAVDYVLKDNRARLVPAVRRALREAAERHARRAAARQLEESELRFQLFMRHLPSAVTMVDASGRVVYANLRAEALVDVDAKSIIGKTVHELYPPAYAELALAQGRQALDSHSDVSNFESVETDKGLRHFHTHRFPLLDRQGHAVLVGTIATDLTENVEQQKKIAHLSQFHALRSAINSAIVRARFDKEVFREVSRAAVSEGGFSAAAIAIREPGVKNLSLVAWDGLGQRQLDSLLSDPRIGAAEGAIHLAMKGRRTQLVKEIEFQSGEPGPDAKAPTRHAALAVVPLVAGDRSIGVLGLVTEDGSTLDAAQQSRLDDLKGDLSFALDHLAIEQRLSYVVEFDSLTGLYNRQAFYERLASAMQPKEGRHETIAVMAFDLQQFRFVNQTLGRDIGDKVLQEFAKRLRSHFGGPSTIVARMSGDRFSIAVVREQASTLGRFLQSTVLPSLARPIVLDGRSIHSSVKIGIAFCPGDGVEADNVMRNAEAALQRAKETVEAYAFYSPEMSAQVAARLFLESRLQTALENGEFQLHYQPKVRLSSRQLLGLEALIRWNDPKRGLVSPMEFIPLLEQTGMIVAVGEWVIKRVVADLREWRGRGFAVPPIAVNVSQRQLNQKDFVETVVTALDGTAGIDLEITESLIMEDTETSIDKLRALRESGIRIVMDDFGTGYSSLSQLVRLPLDALKIDRAFVSSMTETMEARVVIATIISLAAALGIDVIAEGVETEEQASMIQALGCTHAQGYLFSRPLPAHEVESQFESRAEAT